MSTTIDTRALSRDMRDWIATTVTRELDARPLADAGDAIAAAVDELVGEAIDKGWSSESLVVLRLVVLTVGDELALERAIDAAAVAA